MTECIWHGCTEEATWQMTIKEEETAPLGDFSGAIHILDTEANKKPLPYCDRHAETQKKQFRFFKSHVFERI